MSNGLKRRVSSMLAFVMLFSVAFSSFNPMAAFGAGQKVDVWDFGCVAEADTSLYENHITPDMINSMSIIGADGKFAAGDADFGGLTINAVANDRMYCEASAKNYGSNGKAQSTYDDGYAANGMWYANGTGGDNRRYAQLDLNAGDELVVYTGASNTGDLSVHFTLVKGEGIQDDAQTVVAGTMAKLKYVADYAGTYRVWFDKALSGKPVINRIVRYPAVQLRGTIEGLGDVTTTGCSVKLTNTTTDKEFEASVEAGTNTFTAYVTPGYTYSATLKGVTGYGFTFASKNAEVPVNAVAAGGVDKSYNIEPKETYTLNGTINGFDSNYDISNLAVTFVPESNDTDVVKANVKDNGFTAVLEPDITYTIELDGVNDYEITSGGSLVYTNVKAVDHVVGVALKEMYDVSGNFVTSDGSTPATGDVTALVFTNLGDGYTYSATIDGNGYALKLRTGEYQTAVSSATYKTSTHVSVKGGAAKKNLYLKTVVVSQPQVDTSVRDIYVGCEGKINNFETVGEAFAAAAVMNPTSEAERVTIHIAPGTYREQISLGTPYVSLVKEGVGEVVLTWYYGIGYKYYSVDGTGYWNDEADFDKYDKGLPAKWGVSTYIKSGAKFFRAEDITFETSFNKYVTDEEIVDGVESDGSMSFVRTLGAKVTSKAATERATALCVEADNAEFKDCKFVGSQDTLYMGAPVRAYYKNCVIEGNTDYIFGSGNAVFDACELRFAGYSDSAVGGYITAARHDKDKWTTAPVEFKGYLFRGCSITNAAKDMAGNEMLSAPGFLGRPWDTEATVTYLNTKVERADAIDPAGWTAMSGNSPQNANYKEYNTTYMGTPVDTASRVAGSMTADEAAAVKATDYFGDWTPVYYTEAETTVDFTTAPFFSSDVDVLLPASGDTFTVKYSLGANDNADASRIDWYRVAADGTETLIKTTSAATKGGNAYKLAAADEGSFVKAVVTPITTSGVVGAAQSTTTAKEVAKGGSGTVITDRPSGKVAVFLAGDSTVKDYSAGAINNSGAARAEGSWGEFLEDFLDSDSYTVRNFAQGGRSSRGFIDGTKADGSDRYMDMIKKEMMKGDYLFIQFGHNDSSASYADRYVPVGTPDADGVFPTTAPSAEGAGDGTFKWYLQEMVNAAKEVGATPVMVTPVSRMYFDGDGKITSHHGSNDEYVTATKQVAEENGIQCIDLYAYTKDLFEESYKVEGNSNIPSALMAPGEKTHHSKIGGFAIAAELAQQLQKNEAIGLSKAVVTPKSTSSVNDKDETEFRVWSDGHFEGYGKNESGAYDASIIDTYWTDYVNGQLKAINDFEPVTEVILGDVDKSGEVTANDAAAILQYALDKSIANNPAYDFSVADIDGAAGVDANDAAFALQKTLDFSFELIPVA